MDEKDLLIQNLRDENHRLKADKQQVLAMKENADGCVGCVFEDVNEWEMPCYKCKRNSKDYWRAKVVE